MRRQRAATAIRRSARKESPARKALRSGNFKLLDRFLSSAEKEKIYDLDFTPIETGRYEDPVIQRFCVLMTFSIQANPSLDFDAAAEFENYLESYRRRFVNGARRVTKSRRASGRKPRSFNAETQTFASLFKAAATSLSTEAKITAIAKETLRRGASDENIRKQKIKIRRALQRVNLLPKHKRKSQGKK